MSERRSETVAMCEQLRFERDEAIDASQTLFALLTVSCIDADALDFEKLLDRITQKWPWLRKNE